MFKYLQPATRSMLIGVVGAPNKGKSTFFSAATLVDAQIANYPFTTITANRGVTYVRSPCPHVALGLKGCNPKNSKCANGVRLVPVGIVDVAGLVPGAHEGRGLGNKFLDDLRQADALIQVIDASGMTDLQGNPAQGADLWEEVRFLEEEIALWLVGIMERGAGRAGGLREAAASLSGLKISEELLRAAAGDCGLEISDGLPKNMDGLCLLAKAVLRRRMPIVVACNKMDVEGAEKNFAAFAQKAQQEGKKAFACSAAVELALRKAAEKGIIDYVPGGKEFKIVGAPSQPQQEALERMAAFLKKHGGSGVQQIIDWIVYHKLRAIVVYPVEDEHRFSNHKGEVLPDAFLVRQGTTAKQLAFMVHSELAQKFIGAIDVKRHIRVGADHVLEDGDVIKVLASH
ncbi:MAG: YchF-related putative GTPase [Candidatus Micrarchaeota archaeon]|nr:YchF-related putative GTPase [Candidatus Micrarchaeota archaeon]